MASPRSILFFVNPHAGKGEIRTKFLEIIEIFTRGGFDVTVRPTSRRAEIIELLPQMSERFDVVAACGGDGTLNEVVTGLMSCDRRPPLAYLPAGTVNDFASSLHISKNLIEAAQAAVSGAPMQLDVGQFNDRFFTYVAAFGAFTDVSYQTPQQTKNLLGRSAYVLEGIKRLPQLKPYHMCIEHDGGCSEGDYLFGMISNATSVGGIRLPAAPNISMSDGLLEVTLLKNPGSLVEAHSTMNALLRQNYETDYITVFRTAHLSIQSPDRAPWTLDGEYGGDAAEISIENRLRAIEVII